MFAVDILPQNSQFDPNKFWDHVFQAFTTITIAFFTVGLPAIFAYLKSRNEQKKIVTNQNVLATKLDAQDVKAAELDDKITDAATKAATAAIAAKELDKKVDTVLAQTK